MTYLGADHRGFALKEKVKGWLNEWQYYLKDLGAESLDPNDDYTKYASLVSEAIKGGDNRGILICGSGVGVDVAANKYDGIRASIGKNVDQVRAGREDDDMNVLVIAADYTKDDEAKDMIKTFLETKFDKAPRHQKRLDDIKKIEENN